jgi:hypothetical protein
MRFSGETFDACDAVDAFDALTADVPRDTVRIPHRGRIHSHATDRHTIDQHTTDDTVLIALTVATPRLADVRRTLHAVLGDALGVYIATIDRRTGRTCLQVEVRAALAERTMAAILHALPEAEFGATRPSHRTDCVRSRLPAH